MNIDFFKSELEQALFQIQRIRHKKTYNSLYRLLTAIVFFAILYAYTNPYNPMVFITTPFVVLFLYLLRREASLDRRDNYWQTRKNICDRELKIARFDITSFIGGKRHEEEGHPFSNDLDLFGHNSLFQYINRTVTPGGEKILADQLKNPFTSGRDILRRQESIKEMSAKPLWLLNFCTLGSLESYKPTDMDELKKFLEEPIPYSRNKFLALLVLFAPFIQLLILLSAVYGYVPYSIPVISFVSAATFAILNNKKISAIQLTLDRKSRLMARYASLFKVMEEANTKSEELLGMQVELQAADTSASVVIGNLSKLLRKLEYRDNVVAGVILNGIFLWDFRQLIAIDRWRSQYKQNIPVWVKHLYTTDSLVSFALFAYANQNRNVFPQISDKGVVVKGENLRHPLMTKEKCVANPADIEKISSFVVITGANMAGKSTYLRTIGVNLLFANCGLPVFADSFEFTPMPLFTSLRTTDSLAQSESYFYAELKRLKLIIDRLNRGEELFIILDEILKGTNSVDKQQGSISLVKQLLSHKCAGIIATHDLALGDLVKLYPQNIANYCFEADIKGDELSFNYQLRSGVAFNMNACFLMKRMGIIIE
ncbi:MAG: MutS-related protein [Bacteroidales bacterium]